MLTFAIEVIPKGLTHLRTTCDGMTVNYTAAQSEMMLPLLRVRRAERERERERERGREGVGTEPVLFGLRRTDFVRMGRTTAQ